MKKFTEQILIHAAKGNAKPLEHYLMPIFFHSPNNFERLCDLGFKHFGVSRATIVGTLKERLSHEEKRSC
jgi:hypothetical protein